MPRNIPGRFVVRSQGKKFGIAVRKGEGFQFRSVHDDFAPLDGRTFRRAKFLVEEVARHAQKGRRPSLSGARNDTRLW